MKKILFLFCFYFLLIEFSQAQITFQKTYGGTGTDDDFGWTAKQTMDGGYIITGFTESFGAGNRDVYLIKTDIYGDTLWTKTFGGINDDKGHFVQQTTDGGYIVTGSTLSFGAGNSDVYLIKTDSIGNILWTKTFGGINNDEGNYVQQTTDGGYIVVGYINTFYNYLIKTDANGDSLWTKAFGGTDFSSGISAQQTTDEGYIITGLTQNFGAGSDDVYLVKTDVNGDILWTKTFGGTEPDAGWSVQQTSDGGYIITGGTRSFGAGNYNVYLIRTDTNGDSLWTKTFGGGNDDFGHSVQQTSDGGYIIAGGTESPGGAGIEQVYLIKTDTNGDTLWTKTFGGSSHDDCNSVQQTTDGGYIIAGHGFSTRVYLIKTDANGNSGCYEGSLVTVVTSPPTQVTSQVTIVTSPVAIVTSPATIVGSGGIATTRCSSVGINEITTDNLFFISSNPSAGKFVISFRNTILRGNLEILNIPGEKILAENIFNESKKEINFKNASNGMYFVKVFDGEKYYCKKIIIEKD